MKTLNLQRFRFLAIASIVIVVMGLLIILVPLIYYENLENRSALWEDGLLHVDQLDLSKGLYQLKGQVVAIENRFVSPNSQLQQVDQTLVNLPFAWHTKLGVNYGSYLFKLDGLIPGDAYGFYLMDVSTAYSLYVDGKLVASQGVPGENKDRSISAARAQAAFFKAQNKSATIVIHISGHDSHIAGLWQKTLFGSLDQIHDYALKARQADAIMVGALLVMALYFWFMYLIMRKDRAIFYFALLCTLVLVKTLYAGQQIGFNTFNFISYNLGLRLAYAMVPMVVCIIIAFVNEIFQGCLPLYVKRITYTLSLIQIFVIFWGPQRFYQGTFVAYQVFAAVLAISLVFWLGRAISKGLQGSIIYTIGYVCFIGIAINDILYSLLFIHTGYYLSLGLFILILSQASLLAMRIQKAFDTEIYLNANLERLVEARTKELRNEKNKFEELSKVDSLTHLYNKGYMLEMLQFEIESYNRYHGDLAIMMIDLDHFKSVNDTYGHIVGDQVLVDVAKVMRAMARRTDVVGRFGGEEFFIILRFTTIDEAMIIAENLRIAISNIVHRGFGATPFHVTASIGVTVAQPPIEDEMQLIHEADSALYRAKNSGRNNVKRPVR